MTKRPFDKGIRFRITPQRPLLMVDVEVNGVGPFNFILDTGASSSVITPDAAKAAGVRPTGKSPIAVGAGGPMKAGFAKLKTLRVGSHKVKNLGVALMDLSEIAKPLGFPVGGVVGYNFLRDYVVTIDYPAGRLHFKRKARKRRKIVRP